MAAKGLPKRKRSVSSLRTLPTRQTKKLKALSQAVIDVPNSTQAVASPISAQLQQFMDNPPDETDEEKLERITTTLVEVHAGLTRCKYSEGLSPSPEVNRLFTRMVVTGIEIVSEALESAIFSDVRIQKIKGDLREYSSDGEGLMEAFHAKRMVRELEQSLQVNPDLAQEKRLRILESFPYYRNYVELTRMEKSIIESLFDINKPPQSYVFIGSGPMPLTAMCLAHLIELEAQNFAARLRLPLSPLDQASTDSPMPTSTCLRIHNIDLNKEAIELSMALAKKIGEPFRSLTFECRAAEETPTKAYEQYDVVYLAALVGNTVEKKMEITKEVLSNMREGSILVLRSAHNLRKLLYEPVDIAQLARIRTSKGMALKVVRVVHPTDEVVNSIVVCKVVDGNKQMQ